MISYIIRRLLLIIPMLLGISLITLLLMHASPADPASIRYGLNPEVSGSARAQFRELYNLDKPVLTQFGLWLKRVVKCDFGNSFIDDVPVIKKIGERLPATLLLGVIAILVIYIIAIP